MVFPGIKTCCTSVIVIGLGLMLFRRFSQSAIKGFELGFIGFCGGLGFCKVVYWSSGFA